MLRFLTFISLFISPRENKEPIGFEQGIIIRRYFYAVNFLLIAISTIFIIKLQSIKLEQDSYISTRINPALINATESNLLKNKIPVDVQVYVWRLADISLKDKILPAIYLLTFNYKEKDFPAEAPAFDVGNGILLKQKLIERTESDGIRSATYSIEANIEPKFMLRMYPLDQELISLRLTGAESQNNYYFRITRFDDLTEGAQNDYTVESIGFVNSVEHPALYTDGNEANNATLIPGNRAYILFNHKNIFSYIKSIQYILLSVLIAIFSLLVNARTNSPKNGRVAVIGSSVFSLAANAFQINSTIRIVNAVTVIDLVTFFSGIIIVLCFLTTVRTLRFLDESGYKVAKLFDLLMCLTFLCYSLFFYSFIYWFA